MYIGYINPAFGGVLWLPRVEMRVELIFYDKKIKDPKTLNTL